MKARAMPPGRNMRKGGRGGHGALNIEMKTPAGRRGVAAAWHRRAAGKGVEDGMVRSMSSTAFSCQPMPSTFWMRISRRSPVLNRRIRSPDPNPKM